MMYLETVFGDAKDQQIPSAPFKELNRALRSHLPLSSNRLRGKKFLTVFCAAKHRCKK